ncbi:hypothetical protein [Neptunicella sp. SCSIO 80796]|uniref:hypothetical protein n=1 Tax=Neptunicella plasticusilytica TaxID=3117012 RepID=UPI003A4D7B22
MTDEKINLYQSFASLAEQFVLFQQHISNQPLTAKHIEQTTLLAKAFVQLAKSDPVIFISLLHTPLSNMPFVYRYIFNSCIVSTLLCLRHRWHETPTTQLLCATLTLHSHRLKAIQNWSQQGDVDQNVQQALTARPTLPRQLKDKHPLWAECWQISWLSLTQLNDISRLTNRSIALQITTLASQLSLQITPGKKRRTIRFASALSIFARTLPAAACQHIELIIQVTGLYPPGSRVKLHSGETAKVLSTSAKGLLVKIASIDGGATTRIELVQQQDIAASLSNRGVRDLGGYLAQWWDKVWQEWHRNRDKPQHYRIHPIYFRLDIPPPTLTDVQEQLGLPEPDTNTLARLISSERSLADYIQQQASLKSRQKLTMTNVKQALLMQGFERTYSILCQQALTIRLEQQRFPCSEILVQFCSLRSAMAGQLAQLSPLSILPEESVCMASFASAGLFTHPQLRSTPILDINPSPTMDICAIFDIEQDELVLEHAIKLAQFWRLDSMKIDAIRYCGRLVVQGKKRPVLTRQLSALLGLSLILAQRLYFKQSSAMTEESLQEYELAIAILNLSEHKLGSAIIAAVEQTKPYMPLVKIGV